MRIKENSKILKLSYVLKNYEDEIKEAKQTKFSLGQIKYAEMHKQATRPLRPLQELTEEEFQIILRT